MTRQCNSLKHCDTVTTWQGPARQAPDLQQQGLMLCANAGNMIAVNSHLYAQPHDWKPGMLCRRGMAHKKR